MLRISLLLVCFVGVFTIFSQSTCFLMVRSGIPSFLTKTESLKSIRNVSQKRILNDSNDSVQHVARVARLRTKSDEKMIINYAKRNTTKRRKRFETTLKNSEGLLAIKPNTSFLKHNSSMVMPKNVLRNVILTLVDTPRHIRDEFWNNFEKTNSFPVHGYFQTDNQEESGPIKIELNEFLEISGSKENECECQQTLRSRISELLIWARRIKEMTTSVLSAINFSIPFVSDMEGDADIAKENELNKKENNSRERIYRNELLQNDSLRSLDSQEKYYTVFQKNYQTNVSSTGDTGNLLDLFTKIKIAFLRAIIDCPNGSTNSRMDDEFSFQESSYLRTSYIDLLDGAMKNLKITSGDKGYILILVIPENELTSVIDLLRYEISPSDTLVIVTELCSRDIKHLSFFADGPEASNLYRIRTIKQLPDIIKSLLSRSCWKQDCHPSEDIVQNQHFYDIPIRIVRDTNGFQFSENAKNITKRFLNNLSLSEKIVVSGTSDIVLKKVNMFIGTVTSLIALMILDSL